MSVDKIIAHYLTFLNGCSLKKHVPSFQRGAGKDENKKPPANGSFKFSPFALPNACEVS
jgi:hypothetical protein